MAELKCSVDNCAYNKSECCCKGDILVGGKHACCDDDTCCESFAESKGDRFTNALSLLTPIWDMEIQKQYCTWVVCHFLRLISIV